MSHKRITLTFKNCEVGGLYLQGPLREQSIFHDMGISL